jgi:hypothetical protein
MIKMKKKILIISIIILTLCVTFSGCVENNNQKQNGTLITDTVANFKITDEDLPEGYIKKYEGEDFTSQFSHYPEEKPIEALKIEFSKGNASNQDEYDYITCELDKFNSIENAEIAFTSTLDYIITTGNFEVINETINIIGNESKAITKEDYYDFLAFRILNVIILISSKDFSFTFELARIIEERIYDSFD